jgi:hypothetical protein
MQTIANNGVALAEHHWFTAMKEEQTLCFKIRCGLRFLFLQAAVGFSKIKKT